MRAYQRPDGSYDVYDVEPKVMSAADYAKLKRVQELNATKESHLAAIAAIDAELKELNGVTVEATAPVSTTAGNVAEPFKRKW